MPIREDLALETLKSIRRGEMLDELSEEISAVVKAAEDSAKVGEVKIVLKFKPNGAGQMVITDETTARKPKPNAPATLMFNDVHGNLSRRDPNQADLPLRKVSETRTEEKKHG